MLRKYNYKDVAFDTLKYMDLEIEPCNNFAPNYIYAKEIPVVDSKISYRDFFNKYLLPNQACVIKNVATDWESLKWSSDSIVNFGRLHRRYGSSDVTVYDCNNRSYNSQKCHDTKFRNYLVYWESFAMSDYSDDFPLLYLKDWHLKEERAEDDFYEVPPFFASDWLNEYLVDVKRQDYRFVYMGPKGSWTPFHSDVFKSFSWSVNVCGRKRWVLLPPGQEKALGDLPYDVEPFLDKVVHYDVIQDAGDAVFVPTGWYHQVWNLTDAISINHNWINGCNVRAMWAEMERCVASVRKEIDDCKGADDFEQQVQVVLKEFFGLDHAMFYDFVRHIALKRIGLLERGENVLLFNKYRLGHRHAMFALSSLEEVLRLFVSSPNVEGLDLQGVPPVKLLEMIGETLIKFENC